MDEFELRRLCRASMGASGQWEYLSSQFARERHGKAITAGISAVEMRAMPNGTGGTDFKYTGYASVYGAPFDMWDNFGEPFTEIVAPGAARRSLNNPDLDVAFLVGHDTAGIALARTSARSLKLADDGHGVHVEARMDGRDPQVQSLASAVDRRNMPEMSLAFICKGDEWDSAYETRTVTAMELNRGDVSAVVYGANPATAGSLMVPAEQLTMRRPALIGGPQMAVFQRLASAAPVAMAHGHPGQPCVDPDGDGDCDLTPEGDTDHDYWTADGKQIKPLPGQDQRASVRLLELLSVTAAERDKAHAAGNSLPDKSYPINNVAQLHSAAVLAASHHGDWQAAQALIRRRAKELGVDVTTLPGFGEEKADGRPLELRASAADDMNLAADPDYDADAAAHDNVKCPQCKTVNDSDAAYCKKCGQPMGAGTAGESATVTVDAGTGIPGEETQYSAPDTFEWRRREMELEELARRPVFAA